MKDDYMMNGQLKAGYNIQIATEGQFALAYDVFSNPRDTRTQIPFLDKIEEATLNYQNILSQTLVMVVRKIIMISFQTAIVRRLLLIICIKKNRRKNIKK